MKKFKVWSTKEGYYLVSAKNKEDAYEKAHNESPEPDFIVTEETTGNTEEVTNG